MTRRHDALVVGIAAAALLALVLPWYAERPYWLDELVSVEIASLSPGRFATYVATVESNMGLYHALLAGWLAVDDAEGWTRLLSVGLTLGTLPYLYGLGVRLFDRRTAAIAVFLMAVNVSFVGHARDLRGYGLALLLVTASTYHLVAARQTGRRRHWVLYGLGMGLAAWAHVLSALVVLAHGVWLVLQRRSLVRRDIVAAAVPLAALVTPLAVAILAGGQEAQLDWLERAPLRQLPGLLEWFVESRPALLVLFVGGLAALGAAYRERRSQVTLRRYPLLLLWLAVPPLAGYALSYSTPVYLYRYFLVCLPAVVLFVAAGFARLRPPWLGVALALAALMLSVRATVSCQPDCKLRYDEWEPAATLIAERSRAGDAIVVYPSQLRTALDHYLPARRPRLLYPERWGLIASGDGQSSIDEALRREVPRRTWLVTWWLPSEPARRLLEARSRLLDAREFPGDVRVELYEPDS